MALSSYNLLNIEVGKVWARCESKKGLKYRIQVVTPDMYEDVHALMEKFFLRDEAMAKSLALAEDPDSLALFHKFWGEELKTNLSIAAVTEEEGKVVGVNMLTVSSKNDPDLMNLVKGEKLRRYIHFTQHHIREMCNLYEHYGVDSYLKGLGMAVVSDYRGHGIGEELLKCRKTIAEVVGIPATANVFTSSRSQHIAQKAGFETLAEAVYKDYTVDGQEAFPGISSPSAKYMGIKY